MLGLAACSGAFAAYVQDAWPAWHYIGHSLVLWTCVAVIAALRGSWLQSSLTTSVALIVAVLTYFIATRVFGPFDYPPLLSPLLAFWIVLAAVGGFGFATICLTAVNRNTLTWLAIGTVPGLLLGDALNASAGIPFLEISPLEALTTILSNPSPIVLIASGATTCWLAAMFILQRTNLGHVWLTLPGFIGGYVLITIPDLLLHFA